ncbi:MAG: HesA/MoeB/ThiF family protein [Actinomycetaceae bacterium]|nr:HesA/MoeB/ThiF family protein [Actinomycetaceae bacterium]
MNSDEGGARSGKSGARIGSRGVRIPLLHAPEEMTEDHPSAERYRRNWLVSGIGLEGQSRLRAARVLVVGAGGLGSPVLLYLTAAGIGTIGVCDSDHVDVSNLARQLLHSEKDVDCPKPDSAERHLGALNSEVRIEKYPHVTREFLEAHGRQWDLIIDCTDTFAAKYLVADWCADSGVPFVWGTVVAMGYQVSVFWSNPPTGVPATHLRMLHPTIPPDGSTPRSTEVGVLGPVVGQTGTLMATEAVKIIAGFGEPLIGRVAIGDALRGRVDILTFASFDEGGAESFSATPRA